MSPKPAGQSRPRATIVAPEARPTRASEPSSASVLVELRQLLLDLIGAASDFHDRVAEFAGPHPVAWETRRFLRTNQSVLPRSPPSDRRPFSRGRRRSTPVAPGRACRMAISRNARSLLALPDFPEFAQAVRYGVPGTHTCVRPSVPYPCRRIERVRHGVGAGEIGDTKFSWVWCPQNSPDSLRTLLSPSVSSARSGLVAIAKHSTSHCCRESRLASGPWS